MDSEGLVGMARLRSRAPQYLMKATFDGDRTVNLLDIGLPAGFGVPGKCSPAAGGDAGRADDTKRCRNLSDLSGTGVSQA